MSCISFVVVVWFRSSCGSGSRCVPFGMGGNLRPEIRFDVPLCLFESQQGSTRGRLLNSNQHMKTH